MLERPAEDDCEGKVERRGGIEGRVVRFGRGRGLPVGEVEAARGLAADRGAKRPMLEQPQGEVVERRGGTIPQLELDLAHGKSPFAGPQRTMVEGHLDGTGGETHGAGQAMDVGGEHGLELPSAKLGAELCREERKRQGRVGCRGRQRRLPFPAPERVVGRFGLDGLGETRAALADAEGEAGPPQAAVLRVVIHGAKVTARAAIARVPHDHRRVLKGLEMVRVSQQLQFDF